MNETREERAIRIDKEFLFWFLGFMTGSIFLMIISLHYPLF